MNVGQESESNEVNGNDVHHWTDDRELAKRNQPQTLPPPFTCSFGFVACFCWRTLAFWFNGLWGLQIPWQQEKREDIWQRILPWHEMKRDTFDIRHTMMKRRLIIANSVFNAAVARHVDNNCPMGVQYESFVLLFVLIFISCLACVCGVSFVFLVHSLFVCLSLLFHNTSTHLFQ